MKFLRILAVLIVSLAGLHAGVIAPPVRPQHLSRIVHYNGPAGSESFCAKNYIYRHGVPANPSTLGCGYEGQEAEIRWQVIRTSAEGDVYLFDIDIPVAAGQPAVQPQEVVFRGKPVVVYQDRERTIVIEPLKTKDSADS
ncbi:hypothetical protein [Cerasicoccus fimbriatus]|uniref:hypothetical protein n=1 Tax=Cerasicoccus fimbriatus TaxID=3014554 RepID=UPI0022B4D98F|nr:hypothetical protein [Cerasicoccus sp. TK19100]